MIRLAPAFFAVALFAGPLFVAPEKAVGMVGLVGLLLAAAGIVTASTYGLAILLLLQSSDLAHRARRADVGAGVVRSQIGHWIGLGAGTLAAALLAVASAHGLAASLPFAATPFLAAAGALGTMVGLAIVIARAARRALVEESIGAFRGQDLS